MGWSNSGFVNRGGGLVVDTFWDLPHTRKLLGTYAAVCKKPPRRLFNTHHNGDHCWGNQLLRDAEIIGHRLCAERVASESPEFMQTLKNAPADSEAMVAELARQLAAWDFTGIEATPPTTLFDERLDLDLDGTVVQLIYVGPAHTAGDAVAHVPEQGVVFAGDVVFRLCTPVGWEGTYERWIAALDLIDALAPELVVPGHGPVCGIDGVREMKAYLEYVRGECRRFFAADLPELEAAKRIDLGPYGGWSEPHRLVSQVYRAYRELRGEPFDAPIDLAKTFGDMLELRRAWARAASGGDLA